MKRKIRKDKIIIQKKRVKTVHSAVKEGEKPVKKKADQQG